MYQISCCAQGPALENQNTNTNSDSPVVDLSPQLWNKNTKQLCLHVTLPWHQLKAEHVVGAQWACANESVITSRFVYNTHQKERSIHRHLRQQVKLQNSYICESFKITSFPNALPQFMNFHLCYLVLLHLMKGSLVVFFL